VAADFQGVFAGIRGRAAEKRAQNIIHQGAVAIAIISPARSANRRFLADDDANEAAVSFPLIRSRAIAAVPAGVAKAAIVSCGDAMARRQPGAPANAKKISSR